MEDFFEDRINDWIRLEAFDFFEEVGFGMTLLVRTPTSAFNERDKAKEIGVDDNVLVREC